MAWPSGKHKTVGPVPSSQWVGSCPPPPLRPLRTVLGSSISKGKAAAEGWLIAPSLSLHLSGFYKCFISHINFIIRKRLGKLSEELGLRAIQGLLPPPSVSLSLCLHICLPVCLPLASFPPADPGPQEPQGQEQQRFPRRPGDSCEGEDHSPHPSPHGASLSAQDSVEGSPLRPQ